MGLLTGSLIQNKLKVSLATLILALAPNTPLLLITVPKSTPLELVTPKPDSKYSSIFKKECLLTDGIGSFENVIKHLSMVKTNYNLN